MLDWELFMSFNELLKERLLLNDGVFLMQRSTSHVNVKLFALYNFYVEVYYDKAEEEPLYIKSFELGQAIDIYLQAIDIDPVFERMR